MLYRLFATVLGIAAAAAGAAPAALATAPGHNGKIAFVEVPRGGGSAIFTARADGGDKDRVTAGSESADQPAWSADGRWLAYHGGGFLRVVRADGSGQRDVTPLNSSNFIVNDHAWSPDGRTLAFTGTKWKAVGDEDIVTDMAVWTIGVDGKGLRRLRAGAAPIYSPDGRSIAYVPAGDGCTGINLMAADGSTPRTLVKSRCAGGAGVPGDFSPSGRTLVFDRTTSFTNEVNATRDLFTVDLRSRKVRRLTATKYYSEEEPRYSPDGTRLVFSRRARRSNLPKVFGTFIATTSGKVVSRFHKYPLRVSWQPLR